LIQNGEEMNTALLSYQKSGTKLAAHIIMDLAGAINLADMFSKKINIISNYLGINADTDSLRFGSFGFKNGNNILLRIDTVDSDNCSVSSDYFKVERDFFESLLPEQNFCLVEHQKPDDFAKHNFTADIDKKFYVYRDFRDVFNSHTGFIDSSRLSYDLSRQTDSPASFQKFKYLDISLFNRVLDEWKSHILSFMEHQDKFTPIRYEDMVSFPEKSVCSIASAMGLDIDEISAKEIASKYLNKNLADLSSEHSEYLHYTGHKKRSGRWREFFNEYMVEKTKEKVGDLLIELGYEKDLDWGISGSEPDEKISDFKPRLDKSCAGYERDNFFRKARAASYVRDIDESLLKDKIAIYGAGSYTRTLLEDLQNKDCISFIIDNDEKKIGSDISGITILGSDALIERFMDYDFIYVAVNPEYYGKVVQKILDSGIPYYKIVNIFDNSYNSERVYIENY
jgi:hypothetical protein